MLSPLPPAAGFTWVVAWFICPPLESAWEGVSWEFALHAHSARIASIFIKFRQKVGQNPCGELPLGRNFMSEQKENYPREP